MSKRVRGLTPSLLGKQKDDEYVKWTCRYFCPRQLFFSLSLPCFYSTHSVVFVGSAANDAATLENGWWDFYRRTGNMGHKTCLHFPQPEKKKKTLTLYFYLFHLPCQSMRPLWEVRILCGRAEMCSTHRNREVALETPQENRRTAGF